MGKNLWERQLFEAFHLNVSQNKVARQTAISRGKNTLRSTALQPAYASSRPLVYIGAVYRRFRVSATQVILRRSNLQAELILSKYMFLPLRQRRHPWSKAICERLVIHSQLSPCGHLAITNTHLKRTVAYKSPAETNYRRLKEINYINSRSLQCPL